MSNFLHTIPNHGICNRNRATEISEQMKSNPNTENSIQGVFNSMVKDQFENKIRNIGSFH